MIRNMIATIIFSIIFSVSSFTQAPPILSSNAEPVNKVIGIVKDSASLKPIEFANIFLFSLKDSTLITGAASRTDGNFEIQRIPPGRYYAKVSFIGYNNQIINEIYVSNQKEILNLGNIILGSSSVKIDEVLVSAEKEAAVFNLDKKIINIEQNLTSAGGTAIDALQNVPSINVDASGNVSLRGNTNITILIDGRPTSLSDGASTILSQIPASSIESIELVTNPSAKHDPEGTAGVINLVMKKKSQLGYNGQLSFNAGNGNKYNSALNFNFMFGKINIFANYDNRFSNSFNSNGTMRNINTTSFSSNQLLDQRGTNYMGLHNINTGVDFMPDNQNTITFSFAHRDMNFESLGLTNYQFSDNNNVLNRLYDISTEFLRAIKSYDYTLSYKNVFKKNVHEFSADVIHTNARFRMNTLNEQTNFDINNPSISSEGYKQKAGITNRNDWWILQANYFTAIGDGGRFEVGLRSSFMDRELKAGWENYDFLTSTWVINPNMQNNFLYNENINSAYAIYTGSLSNFKYQFGLRGELVSTQGELIENNETFEKKYSSLYPTIHLSQSFEGNNEFKLSYSRRVNRPNNRQLNPFVFIMDSSATSQGNPQLMPEYVNSLEFGYQKGFKMLTLSSNLFYRLTEDLISSITNIDQQGISRSTFLNLNNSTAYGIELVSSQTINKDLRVNANVSYFRTEIKGTASTSELNQNSYSWTARLNSNYNLMQDLSLQLTANYNAPIVMAQMKMEEQFGVDLGARKTFMNGALALNLRVSDVFNTRKFNSESFGNGFNTFSRSKNESRNVFLGITYSLNNFKAQERKTGVDSSDF
ncbi:MAG: hypothetical protein C0425_02585 [Chlorobiaceae bacterium]|nr:hypothetical protein [Chlorobiaceae bacterium]MBA4309208.1 hypothetical protein [Chlorobiaceae bacterium]